MPIDLILSLEWPSFSKILSAPSMQFSTDLIISSGSCSCHLHRFRPDQHIGKELCLPWVGINLAELLLVNGDWLTLLVEYEEARAGSALVNAANEDLV